MNDLVKVQAEYDALEAKINEYLRTCSRACIGGAKLSKMSARSNELREILDKAQGCAGSPAHSSAGMRR